MDHIEIKSNIKPKEISKRVFSAIKTTALIYIVAIAITIMMFVVTS